MTESEVETELKIPVEDLADIRSTLGNRGAERVTESRREVNLLLDSGDRELSGRGCLLRLRRYGTRHMLTFKGPATFDGPIKVRPEHELEIEDITKMLTVLGALGFSPCARYEKDRECWRLGDVEVVLDHTPMGDFIEIEGPSESLVAATQSLGLDPSRAVRGSYMSLWADYRARESHQDLPADMVFAE